MASIVDIWNTALSNIGHKANIADPDEQSAEANHCRRFYPLALNMSLERYAWSFATRREQLAEVENSARQWMFAYGMPNACVAMRAVLPPETTDDSMESPYSIEGDADGNLILYTNQPAAVARFTTLIEDTTKFTPLFVLALAADLASLLVGPIPKDTRKRQEMQQLAIYYTGQAAANDANNGQQSDRYTTFTPDHMRNRG